MTDESTLSKKFAYLCTSLVARCLVLVATPTSAYSRPVRVPLLLVDLRDRVTVVQVEDCVTHTQSTST